VVREKASPPHRGAGEQQCSPPGPALPGRDRPGAGFERSRPRTSGRQTMTRDSPRQVVPEQVGPGWQVAGVGPVWATTGILCPLARWPRQRGEVARPDHHRAGRSRCQSQQIGPAREASPPTAETPLEVKRATRERSMSTSPACIFPIYFSPFRVSLQEQKKYRISHPPQLRPVLADPLKRGSRSHVPRLAGKRRPRMRESPRTSLETIGPG